MLERLVKIASGKMKATEIDVNFYKHEMRESQLMKGGMKYDEAHHKVLEEQGTSHPNYDQKLYTKEALDAGNKALYNEQKK
jgi:filamentous hemagglutinin